MKKTAEQIEAIYTAGNILVSASAELGRPCFMQYGLLDQLARGVEISQLFISDLYRQGCYRTQGTLGEKISQQIQETDDVGSQTTLGTPLVDLPNAAIGTMDSFSHKIPLGKHVYLSIDIAPNFRILQNESEQLP